MDDKYFGWSVHPFVTRNFMHYSCSQTPLFLSSKCCHRPPGGGGVVGVRRGEVVWGLDYETKHAFRWEGFQTSKLLMYGRKMRDRIIAESIIGWLKLTFLEKILENLGWWWWMLRRKIGRTRKVGAFVVNKKGVDC